MCGFRYPTCYLFSPPFFPGRLDMFGDKIAVKYGTRESMRIKYSG